MREDLEVGLRRIGRVAALGVMMGAALSTLMWALRTGRIDDFRLVEALFDAAIAVRLGLGALLLAGIARLRPVAPAVALLALVCLGLDLLVDGVRLGLALVGLDGEAVPPGEPWLYTASVVGRLASLMAEVGVAWLLGAAAIAAGAPRLAVAGRLLAAGAGVQLLLVVADTMQWAAFPSWGFLLDIGLDAAGATLALLVLRTLGPVPAERRAAAGLQTYRGAVLLRLLLFVGLTVAMVLARQALDRPQLAVLLAILLPLATVLPAVVMVEGLVRFAHLPAARLATALPLLLLVAGLAADAWCGWLLADIVYDDAIRHADLQRVNWLGLAGTLLALATLATLLSAFARVVRAYGLADLAPRLRAVGLLMAGVVLATLGLHALARAGGVPAVAGLLLVLGALVLAVVAVARYLAIVADLARGLDQAHRVAADTFA